MAGRALEDVEACGFITLKYSEWIGPMLSDWVAEAIVPTALSRSEVMGAWRAQAGATRPARSDNSEGKTDPAALGQPKAAGRFQIFSSTELRGNLTRNGVWSRTFSTIFG